jgi:hypothetical protein
MIWNIIQNFRSTIIGVRKKKKMQFCFRKKEFLTKTPKSEKYFCPPEVLSYFLRSNCIKKIQFVKTKNKVLRAIRS